MELDLEEFRPILAGDEQSISHRVVGELRLVPHHGAVDITGANATVSGDDKFDYDAELVPFFQERSDAGGKRLRQH